MRGILGAKKIAKIPPQELTSIFKQGATLRLPYLEGRLLKARENVKNYEKKYNNTLNQLKTEGLPEDAGYELHEDFIEWEYWEEVLHETVETIGNIKKLLDEI